MKLFNHHAQKGSTLAELMIVVAIIGILAAVATHLYGKYIIRSKMSEIWSIAREKTDSVSLNGCKGESQQGLVINEIKFSDSPPVGDCEITFSLKGQELSFLWIQQTCPPDCYVKFIRQDDSIPLKPNQQIFRVDADDYSLLDFFIPPAYAAKRWPVETNVNL